MLKQSLPLRVLAICFLFLALPLIIFSFVYFNEAFQVLIKRAYTDLEQAAFYRTIALKETAPVPNNFLQELQYLLDLENEIPKLPNPEFTKKLQKLTASIPGIDVYVLDKGLEGRYQILARDSTTIKRTGIGPPYFVSYHPLAVKAKDGISHYLRYYYSDEQKKLIPYVYSVLEIDDPNSHENIGFLVLQKNIEHEMESILSDLDLGPHTISFAILDSFEFISGASDPTLVGQRFRAFSEEQRNQILEQINLVGKPSFFGPPLKIKKNATNPTLFEFTWNGQVQLGALPLHYQMGDEVFAYVPKKVLFLEAINRFIIFYITFAVIGILGATMTYLLTRWLSRPLVQLLNLMKKVHAGNMNERFKPEKLGFELNTLGLIYNKTLNSISENMKRGQEERLQKESYLREISVGKRVQQALLPKVIPDVKGTKLSTSYVDTKEVGGDFYDFFYRDQKLFIICADASGVGLSPSLYALDVRSFFRAYGLMYSEIAELMRLVNNAFCDDTGDSGMFATAIAATYHPQTKVLSYYSAGHISNLVKKRNGEIIELDQRGPALGLVKADKFMATSMVLEEGDLLLIFTQGLVELLNARDEPLSFNRIKETFQKSDWQEPDEVIAGIQQEVKDYLGEVPNSEEYTILVMKIEN